MARRILLIVILLAICAAVIALCAGYLNASAQVLTAGVDACYAVADDPAALPESVARLYGAYRSRRTLLAAMMNNRTLDEVDALMEKLRLLSGQADCADVIKENLAALRYQVGRMQSDSAVDLKNIF